MGTAGAILRWSGTAWAGAAAPAKTDLYAVWGAASRDVWSVGAAGTIEHWDGATWSPRSSGVAAALRAVWGNSTSDVWAVGDSSTALHWDGVAWSARAVPGCSGLDAVWGSRADDVWAAGNDGMIFHWDGVAWTARTNNNYTPLYGIAGSGSGDVWAVGGGAPLDVPTTLVWNATAWSLMPFVPYSPGRAVWLAAPHDPWVATDDGVARWDGATWTSVAQPRRFMAGFSPGPTSAWVVGDLGTILRQ